MPAFVPAAARTMNLFEAFAQQRRELSNAEVAKLLGMAESSSIDLLHTLLEAGYLMRTARSRRYYPTARLAALVQAITSHNPLVAAAQDAVELLCEQTGETALCGVLGDHHVEVLVIREGRYALRFITAAGTRIGLHVSALGRALLAQLDPADAAERLGRAPLKAVTPTSTTDPAALQRLLREVQRRGYAWVDGEGTEGVAAMAVAGAVGGERLALSISGPAERLRRHRSDYEQVLLQVKEQVFGAPAPAAAETASARAPRRRTKVGA
jgi:DNA-binding IclR family transcriptional regulator